MAESLQIKIDQYFFPFSRSESLPETLETDISPRDSISKVTIDLMGVEGHISLKAEPMPEDILITRTTPLSGVEMIKKLEGDQIYLTKVPLSLEVGFNIRSMEDWHRIQTLSAEFNINGVDYYLRCGGCESEAVAERSLAEHYDAEVFDASTTDNSGQEFLVLLPYDLDALGQIRARIIEKVVSK